LKKAGADFLELPLSVVFKEGEEARGAARLAGLGLPVEVWHALLPGELKVAGSEVVRGRVDNWLRHSMMWARAASAGGVGPKVLVFGSGRARAVEEGFAREEAEQQLLWALHRAADHARAEGFLLAIEPLERASTNMMNTLAEAVRVVERMGRKGVGVTADTRQMAAEEEPLTRLAEAGGHLLHVHVSGPGASPPAEGAAEFEALFETLGRTGYTGRVSIECAWTDFARQAPQAISFLKEVERRCRQ